MNASIDKYADRLSRRRLRRRKYPIVPARITSRLPRIKNPGAVLWDVYGTLLALAVGAVESSLEQKETMLDACRLTAKEFDFADYLESDPAENLLNMYIREIESTHRRKRRRGVFSPEVRIERIWLRILKKLVSNGYEPERAEGDTDLDLALQIAYFFDDIHQTKVLYPGARQTLETVKKLGLRQGIISNAQFYTPIALRILLRRSAGRADDPMKELFDGRLIFFSYRLGVSKPNPLAFERACSRLKSMGVAPSEVLCVGNDVLNDMVPARKAGFRCVLFAGDAQSLTLRKERPECAGFKPDAVIKSLPEILRIMG